MLKENEVKRSVQELYLAHPYPQWTKEIRRHRFASELCRYRFLGLEKAMKGARFLEVGCGTGNRSMLAAKYFGVKEFVGLDHSAKSLEIALEVSKEEGYSNFKPLEADLFDIPYKDGDFDIVVSWGVLHHAHDPFKGFKEMVRVCRPGGYIGVFLYNYWNHLRHNIQKNRVSKLAGNDFEERFNIAHKLYGTKPVNQMTPEEIVVFYDQYCHPHKSDHTIGETLNWFKKLGLDYLGSFTPLRFRDTINYLGYRYTLSNEYPINSPKLRMLSRLMSKISAKGNPYRFRYPTILHRFIWQIVWAWRGRHGAYSDGAALSAQKKG